MENPSNTEGNEKPEEDSGRFHHYLFIKFYAPRIAGSAYFRRSLAILALLAIA
jgi:hypothetical protein